MADAQDQQSNDIPQGDEPLALNVFAATAAALVHGAEKSTIKPAQGELKRTFRLTRLLLCLLLGIAGLVITVGLFRVTMLGAFKYVLILLMAVFTGRCFLVTSQLWRRLR